MSERHFLDQDPDSHWYIVPVSKRAEWADWCNLGEDDERSWTPPEWAEAVGGSPTLITFEDPRNG